MLFSRPQPLDSSLGGLNNKFGLDDKRNRFQFLKQDLNLDLSNSPVKGSGQSGDDYSYGSDGYDYKPPT